MKRERKILAALIVIVILVGININVFGLEDTAVRIEDGVLTVTGVDAVTSTLIYEIQESFTTVILEEGITSIGSFAFQSKTTIEEIYLPKSLTTIAAGAFKDCVEDVNESELTESDLIVYYAGTEEYKNEHLTISNSYNNFLKNATWVYSTVPPVENSLSLTSARVTPGSVATVKLSIDKACTGLGAQLSVSAVNAEGKSLPISSVTLPNSGGAVSEDEEGNCNGTIVIGSGGDFAAGAVLAEISFNTAGCEGEYILDVTGDMYTGNGNAPVRYTVNSATVSVRSDVTVTWKNGDDVIKTEKIAYGGTPSYTGETPAKAEDDLYTYSFSGWSPEVGAITGDTEYSACFTANPKSYLVSIGCGIPGAKVNVSYNGTALDKNLDGSYTLTAGQTYLCTVKVVGYNEISMSISLGDENGIWSFNGSTASLSIAPPSELNTGDTNDDGSIDMKDAQALFNYLAGNLSLDDNGAAYKNGAVAFTKNTADINGNGKVGADDILPLLALISTQAGSGQ